MRRKHVHVDVRFFGSVYAKKNRVHNSRVCAVHRLLPCAQIPKCEKRLTAIHPSPPAHIAARDQAKSYDADGIRTRAPHGTGA